MRTDDEEECSTGINWPALNIKWNEWEEKVEVLENMLIDAQNQKTWYVHSDHNTYADGTDITLYFSTYKQAWDVYSDEGLVFGVDGEANEHSDRDDYFSHQRCMGGEVVMGELGIDGLPHKCLYSRKISLTNLPEYQLEKWNEFNEFQSYSTVGEHGAGIYHHACDWYGSIFVDENGVKHNTEEEYLARNQPKTTTEEE